MAETNAGAARLALLKLLKDGPQMMSRSRLIEFLQSHGSNSPDAFINALAQDGVAEIMPRSAQGVTEQIYELRIKMKGRLLVQNDSLKDSPIRMRLAEKFRKLAEINTDIADLFEASE